MEKKEQVFLYMKEEIERLANLEEEKILSEAKELEEGCQSSGVGPRREDQRDH